MYPLKTTRDMRNLKLQHEVRNMPNKRLPAMVDRAIWDKVTKRRVGIRWDSVLEKTKGIGGHREEMMSAKKFGGYTEEVEERIEKRERLALRNKVKSENHLEVYTRDHTKG